jgi:hypothetical protein
MTEKIDFRVILWSTAQVQTFEFILLRMLLLGGDFSRQGCV